MASENKLQEVVQATLAQIRNMIDADTVIGTPIETASGTTIIPISKVSLGFVSGGGEYNNQKKKRFEVNYPFAGGSGGGCNITPIGFLVIIKDNVRFIKVDCESNIEKVIDIASEFVKSIK